MDLPKSELFSVVQEFNPWWNGIPLSDLPDWERPAIGQVLEWVNRENSKRALLVAGARQVGKTTILRQAIRRIIQSGFPPTNILYATFDHPILKLVGLERTLQIWDELYPRVEAYPRLLFLDEIQYVPDWQTWLKHQVDFRRQNRVVVTGSSTPLKTASSESGVGRWETIPLPTLAFGEYLKLRGIATPKIEGIKSLRQLFSWEENKFIRVAEMAKPLTAHFHEYLLRGGFPEPALENDLSRCQRLLREDIVDKVLKRDMTALYGVRRVLEVEKLFLYLCYHDGGILDIATLARQFDGISRSVVANFIDLFEATHLIYRLKPFGYGKEVLRGRDKVYLADAALSGAVLLLGRKLLGKPDKLGAAVETAFFKHAYTRYYANTPTFSYWRDSKKELEVDLICEMGDRIVPFEIKYQDRELTQSSLKGLRLLMEQRKIEEGYVITQRWTDFGVYPLNSAVTGSTDNKLTAKAVAIPAPLACYWMSDIG